MPSWVPLSLFVLACPVGMGLVMFFVMKGMRGERNETVTGHKDAVSPEARLARLEAEKRALEKQIATRDQRSGDATTLSPDGKKFSAN